jgi:hypothetical protein
MREGREGLLQYVAVEGQGLRVPSEDQEPCRQLQKGVAHASSSQSVLGPSVKRFRSGVRRSPFSGSGSDGGGFFFPIGFQEKCGVLHACRAMCMQAYTSLGGFRCDASLAVVLH